jgi:integral membrane sensor domain MASE1
MVKRLEKKYWTSLIAFASRLLTNIFAIGNSSGEFYSLSLLFHSNVYIALFTLVTTRYWPQSQLCCCLDDPTNTHAVRGQSRLKIARALSPVSLAGRKYCCCARQNTAFCLQSWMLVDVVLKRHKF